MALERIHISLLSMNLHKRLTASSQLDLWVIEHLNRAIDCMHDPGPTIVQELCESRGGGPGLSVLTSLLVSVDVKIY